MKFLVITIHVLYVSFSAGLFGLIAFMRVSINNSRIIFSSQKSPFFLASLFSMGGGVIAGRQIYLQNLPSDQVPTCAPPMDFLMDTLPIFEVVQTVLLGDGNCAEYEWRFIFNFAEWALIFFVFLFLYNLYFLFKKPIKI